METETNTTTPDLLEVMLSAEQVAKAVGLSTRTINQFCQLGRFEQVYKLGGRWRIPQASYQKWLENHCFQAHETGAFVKSPSMLSKPPKGMKQKYNFKGMV